MALSEGLGVIPYNPLGGGLLTGKYSSKSRPDVGRLVENAMYSKRYGEAAYYDIAERFASYAESKGVHPATLAVAWVGTHPGVTAPIIGARNTGQLEASLAATSFEMTPEMRTEIAALSPEPPPATDRSEERKV
jgi:aryl-alcohol dehydrogenase-like predicted oxidoreductase